MGLTAAMSVGQTALASSQAAIQVIGNNIANAATPGYSRQIVSLAPLPGQSIGNTSLGLGVSISGVRRQVDTALQGRLWTSQGNQGAAGERLALLGSLETSLNELTGYDLSSQISQFFASWSERANLTQSSAVVVQQGAQLASFIRGLRSDLATQREGADALLDDYAARADELIRGIADLNTQIPPAEASGGTANELRDRRDILVGELATLMDVTAIDQGDGTVNVLVGSTPVVLGGNPRTISLERRSTASGIEVAILVGAEQRELSVNAGKIGALLAGRTDSINATLGALDDIASTLIFEVNRLHSTGASRPGLRSATGTLSIALDDRTRPLNDSDNATLADLPFHPSNGGFTVAITDQTTNTTRRVRIDVDMDGLTDGGLRGTGDDTTPEDIRAALDAVPGLNAAFDNAGRLRLTADAGTDFNFEDDTSGVLATLGINTYFTGRNSTDIDVRQSLVSDPQNLMVGRQTAEGYAENATALAINDLRTRTLDALGGRSLTQRWQDEVQTVAGQTATASTTFQAASIVTESLSAQQAAISGVSLDEEAINLTTFQRQYQGAARLVAVADQLLQELLSII
ncbi:MAG: flagellar hook-associated protein FlgK [Phycisphaerales bacterium]